MLVLVLVLVLIPIRVLELARVLVRVPVRVLVPGLVRARALARGPRIIVTHARACGSQARLRDLLHRLFSHRRKRLTTDFKTPKNTFRRLRSNPAAP